MAAVFWHIVSPNHPTASLVLPPKLFYIRHGHSQAYATDDGGFVSRAPYRDISDEVELKKNATMHFDWTNWGWESCFISAFGDKAHAVRWSRKRYLPVTVYELDTQKLPPGTLVLNAFMLCNALGLNNSFNEQGKDEFLFYRGIPGSCVESISDPWAYCPQIVSPPIRRRFLSCWVDIVKEAETAQNLHKVQSSTWTNASTGPAATALQTLDWLITEEARLRQKLEELKRQQSIELNTDAIYNLPNVVDNLAGQMEEVLDLSTNVETRTRDNRITPRTTVHFQLHPGVSYPSLESYPFFRLVDNA